MKRIVSFVLCLILCLNCFCVLTYATETDSTSYQLWEDVAVQFDDDEQIFDVLLIDDYPCMTVGDVAEIIGATLEGNTLVKDTISITYTENDRLADFGEGHIVLERAPYMYEDELYIPVSSLVPTFGYHMEFWRFEEPRPIIQITTGTNYSTVEPLVFYAKDYGVAGDGIKNDKDCLLKAFYEAAYSATDTQPTKLVLEENAVYRVGERSDQMAIFTINDVENFTLEGNGSKVVLDTPTNSFIALENCSNVKIQNISIDWKEHTSTQGRVVSVDPTTLSFNMVIDEGFPLPPNQEWVDKYSDSWSFGQVMDSQADRLKMISTYHYFVDSVDKVSGREYKITVTNAHSANHLRKIEIDDRFVLQTKTKAYDFSTDSGDKDGLDAAIRILYSKDILLDGVEIYGSLGMGMSIGMCSGRIVIRNYGMKLKEKALETSNSDGIHYWRNRAGLIYEDSEMYNNLDDHINTKGEDAVVLSQINDKSYTVDYNLNYRVGDELLFYNKATKQLYNKTFLKEYSSSNGVYTLVLDRTVDGMTATDIANGNVIIWNASASAKGTIIRNNRFINSRRHAYISRSANSIYEGNYIENCGGSGLAAMNELTDEANEGPFPSSFTMRNNTIYGVGNVSFSRPIEIKSWNATTADNPTKAIDGFLIEGNDVNVYDPEGAIYIDSVKDLYMIDNIVKYDEGVLNYSTIPVEIVNSEIKSIDGFTFDYSGNVFNKVSTMIKATNCVYNSSDIKNISDINDMAWSDFSN